MREPLYRLIDDPRPSALSNVAVNPVWPLLASMLGGCWLGWPWFAVNAFAIGSANRKRDLLLIVGAVVVVALLVPGTAVLAALVFHQRHAISYLMLIILGVKLTVGYALLQSQQMSFELYRYFGGAVRNGALLAIAANFAREYVLNQIPDHGMWGAILLWVLL